MAARQSWLGSRNGRDIAQFIPISAADGGKKSLAPSVEAGHRRSGERSRTLRRQLLGERIGSEPAIRDERSGGSEDHDGWTEFEHVHAVAESTLGSTLRHDRPAVIQRHHGRAVSIAAITCSASASEP